MTESASQEVRTLVESHAADHDGGYGLIDDLAERLINTPSPLRDDLERAVLELVLAHDKRLWAVALEALVEANAKHVAPRLNEGLRGNESAEWRQQVIHALIRLRYEPERATYRRYIETELGRDQPSALPLLASFAYLDAHAAVSVAARLFATVLAHEGGPERVDGYVPAIVRSLADIDPELVGQLVEKTTGFNPVAGGVLQQLLARYLAKDFVASELGQEAMKSMRRSLPSPAWE